MQNSSSRSRGLSLFIRLRDEREKKTGFVYSIKDEIPIVQGIFMLYQGGTKVLLAVRSMYYITLIEAFGLESGSARWKLRQGRNTLYVYRRDRCTSTSFIP